MKSNQSYFQKSLFQFLVELKFNNERSWFQANKARYEAELKRPSEAFLAVASSQIKKRLPQYSEAKLYRIYRDIRFSKDKTPYKTHVAMDFGHRAARDSERAPGFYLHLEPGESYLAGGLWSPEPEQLKKIRRAIQKRGSAWSKFVALPLWGESYARPPKDVDPKHPYAEAMKHKHFISWLDFKDSEILAPDFLGRFMKSVLQIKPFILFLNGALGFK